MPSVREINEIEYGPRYYAQRDKRYGRGEKPRHIRERDYRAWIQVWTWELSRTIRLGGGESYHEIKPGEYHYRGSS